MGWVVVEDTATADRCRWVILDDHGEPASWLNDFLNAQHLRGLSPFSLRSYAHQLLHFARWWWPQHRAWTLPPPSTWSHYIRAQMREDPPPAPATINYRLKLLSRLCRFHFGSDVVCGDTRLGRQYRRFSPLGYGRPRLAWSEPRVKQPHPVVVPLTADEVARFWASFRTCRDMAMVALMLLNGLRSGEVLSIELRDVAFAEARLLVHGKGRRERLLPLAAETMRLLQLYLHTERPPTSSPSLFVCLKGRARGYPLTRAGLRSLFRHHRNRAAVAGANPHRFRHTFGADMIRAGVSLPALMRLMGHAYIETTIRYICVSPEEVWREYARAVQSKAAPLVQP